MFYDFRFYKDGDASLWTDVWISLFNKDLTKYLGEIRLTDTSFDSRQFMRRFVGGGPYNNSLFIGDYVKLESYENTFLATFAITNPPFGIGPTPPVGDAYVEDFRNRQDVVFRKIKYCKCMCTHNDDIINQNNNIIIQSHNVITQNNNLSLSEKINTIRSRK
jgi:hypothetical protein